MLKFCLLYEKVWVHSHSHPKHEFLPFCKYGEPLIYAHVFFYNFPTNIYY